MKYGVLLIIASLLCANISLAEEPEGFRLDPSDMAIYMLEDTFQQPNFTRQPFRSFHTEAWHLKFLECFSKMEYGIERRAYLPEPGLPPQRKALVTRFQLFDKPIYLTFSLSR